MWWMCIISVSNVRIIKDFAASILAHNQKISYNVRIIKECAGFIYARNQRLSENICAHNLEDLWY